MFVDNVEDNRGRLRHHVDDDCHTLDHIVHHSDYTAVNIEMRDASTSSSAPEEQVRAQFTHGDIQFVHFEAKLAALKLATNCWTTNNSHSGAVTSERITVIPGSSGKQHQVCCMSSPVRPTTSVTPAAFVAHIKGKVDAIRESIPPQSPGP